MCLQQNKYKCNTKLNPGLLPPFAFAVFLFCRTILMQRLKLVNTSTNWPNPGRQICTQLNKGNASHLLACWLCLFVCSLECPVVCGERHCSDWWQKYFHNNEVHTRGTDSISAVGTKAFYIYMAKFIYMDDNVWQIEEKIKTTTHSPTLQQSIDLNQREKRSLKEMGEMELKKV